MIHSSHPTLKLVPILLLLAGCNQVNRRNAHADASGVFEATEVVVSAQASGLIMELTLSEGEEVEANKAIGYIDTTALHLKKKQLMANIRAVEGRKSNVPIQIAAIQEQIEIQKRELERFTHLVIANAATQKQVDDISSSINVLEKQLAAQTNIMQNNNVSVAHEQLALEMQLAQIEDQIAKSIITSPIHGTILSKYAERGEVAAPGKPLFKVANINLIYLRAYIVAEQLTLMKMGQKVVVVADFGEKECREYDGWISWISNQAEFTPKNIQTRSERDNLVYALKIAVQNDGYLKIGMYGEVRIR